MSRVEPAANFPLIPLLILNHAHQSQLAAPKITSDTAEAARQDKRRFLFYCLPNATLDLASHPITDFGGNFLFSITLIRASSLRLKFPPILPRLLAKTNVGSCYIVSQMQR